MRFQEEEYPNFDNWYKSFFLVFQVRLFPKLAMTCVHVHVCLTSLDPSVILRPIPSFSILRVHIKRTGNEAAYM